MGSRIFAAGEAAAGDQLVHVPEWFAGWEQRFSRFRPTSELSRLNAQAGAWVTVSVEFWDVLLAALEAARRSNGLATPLVLPALVAAGYDRSFTATAPFQAVAAEPVPIIDWRTIELDPLHRAVRLPTGALLDLGGIVKGWAAETAVVRLSAAGPALVDAGGDIAVSGPCADGRAWPIAVADPLASGAELDVVLLTTGGVATSGRDYRYWQANGQAYHHIIDPRSGLPALSDVLSATVVAPSTLQAEAAAKTVLILGAQAGLNWLDDQPAYAGLLCLADGSILPSRDWRAYSWQKESS